MPPRAAEPTPEGYRRHIITAVSHDGDYLKIEYGGRVFVGIMVAELPPGIEEAIRPGTEMIIRTHDGETGNLGEVAHILIPHPTEEGWAEVFCD